MLLSSVQFLFKQLSSSMFGGKCPRPVPDNVRRAVDEVLV